MSRRSPGSLDRLHRGCAIAHRRCSGPPCPGRTRGPAGALGDGLHLDQPRRRRRLGLGTLFLTATAASRSISWCSSSCSACRGAVRHSVRTCRPSSRCSCRPRSPIRWSAWPKDPAQQAGALLLVVFIGVVSGLAVVMNRSFRNTVSLRFRTEAMATDLARQKEIAEQANRAKSSFLAAASHDLASRSMPSACSSGPQGHRADAGRGDAADRADRGLDNRARQPVLRAARHFAARCRRRRGACATLRDRAALQRICQDYGARRRPRRSASPRCEQRRSCTRIRCWSSASYATSSPTRCATRAPARAGGAGAMRLCRRGLGHRPRHPCRPAGAGLPGVLPDRQSRARPSPRSRPRPRHRAQADLADRRLAVAALRAGPRLLLRVRLPLATGAELLDEAPSGRSSERWRPAWSWSSTTSPPSARP